MWRSRQGKASTWPFRTWAPASLWFLSGFSTKPARSLSGTWRPFPTRSPVLTHLPWSRSGGRASTNQRSERSRKCTVEQMESGWFLSADVSANRDMKSRVAHVKVGNCCWGQWFLLGSFFWLNACQLQTLDYFIPAFGIPTTALMTIVSTQSISLQRSDGKHWDLSNEVCWFYIITVHFKKFFNLETIVTVIGLVNTVMVLCKLTLKTPI